MALNGAPGRDGPASGKDGGSEVAMQCIETVGRCRVSVKRCAGSRKEMRNAWIRNKLGGRRPVAITARFILSPRLGSIYTYSYPISIKLTTQLHIQKMESTIP